MLVSAETAEREEEHRQVERDLRFVRDRVRRHERRESPAGRRRRAAVPSDAGGEREDQALGQQLPHQPPAARAERRADGHLALARRRPRQQQVRDVRARDQQQQPDRAEQHPEVAGRCRSGTSP